MGAHARSESQVAKRVDAHRSPEHPVSRRGRSPFRARSVPVPELVCAEFTDLLPELRLRFAERPFLPRVVPVDHLLDGFRDGVAAPGAKGSAMDRFQANLL